MAIEEKVTKAIATFDNGTKDAQSKGLGPEWLMRLSKIGRLLRDQATVQASEFDARSDKLLVGADKLMPGQRDQTWSELQKRYTEYNAWLKKFRGALEGAVKAGDELSPTLKQHFVRPLDILNKDLDAISNALKIEYKGSGDKYDWASGKTKTAEQEKIRALEELHLRIRKACDEAESGMKAYMAKPSEKTFMGGFTGSQSFRTLGTTKQLMVKMGQKYGKEQWYAELLKLYAGIKPETLGDVAQNKNSTHWEGVYGKFARGGDWWNVTQARVEAQRLLTKDIPKWRQFAVDVKKLYKP